MSLLFLFPPLPCALLRLSTYSSILAHLPSFASPLIMPDNEKNYLDITTTAGWLGWLNKKNSRKRVFSQDERVYLATNFYRWKHGADAHGSRKPIEEEICNGYFTKFPKPPFVQEGSYLGAEWEEKNKTQRCKVSDKILYYTSPHALNSKSERGIKTNIPLWMRLAKLSSLLTLTPPALSQWKTSRPG